MLADIIKIHCLTHRANFPMPRTSRMVVCKEGGEEHILSNNFPYQGLWIYCCNCRTFIAWVTDHIDVSLRQCPFCLSSLNPRLYACDHCAVTMLDFDDQTLRKHHTVLSWGMPQPACPGCHQFPGATPKTHFCETLQCNLATARTACPFCMINLDDIFVDGARTTSLEDSESYRIEVELAQARVTAESRARAEAEAKAREAQELWMRAEATARKEAEMRAIYEQKAREFAERRSNHPSAAQAKTPAVTRKDKLTIALIAAIAASLFLALVMLVMTLVIAGQQSAIASPAWLLPGLSILSVLVFSALLYALAKLGQKLREGGD